MSRSRKGPVPSTAAQRAEARNAVVAFLASVGRPMTLSELAFYSRRPTSALSRAELRECLDDLIAEGSVVETTLVRNRYCYGDPGDPLKGFMASPDHKRTKEVQE